MECKCQFEQNGMVQYSFYDSLVSLINYRDIISLVGSTKQLIRYDMRIVAMLDREPSTAILVLTPLIGTHSLRLALVKCTTYLSVYVFVLSHHAIPTSMENTQMPSLLKQ